MQFNERIINLGYISFNILRKSNCYNIIEIFDRIWYGPIQKAINLCKIPQIVANFAFYANYINQPKNIYQFITIQYNEQQFHWIA